MSDLEDQLWQQLAEHRRDIDAQLDHPMFGAAWLNAIYLNTLEVAFNNTQALLECRG
jgi:hypothetical protein